MLYIRSSLADHFYPSVLSCRDKCVNAGNRTSINSFHIQVLFQQLLHGYPYQKTGFGPERAHSAAKTQVQLLPLLHDSHAARVPQLHNYGKQISPCSFFHTLLSFPRPLPLSLLLLYPRLPVTVFTREASYISAAAVCSVGRRHIALSEQPWHGR